MSWVAVLDDLAVAVREIRNLGDKDFGHFLRLREVCADGL